MHSAWFCCNVEVARQPDSEIISDAMLIDVVDEKTWQWALTQLLIDEQARC